MSSRSRKSHKTRVVTRNMVTMQMILRTGGHAGRHSNKAIRGTGSVKGKLGRHPKHKGKVVE
jgi:hypothetical protein